MINRRCVKVLIIIWSSLLLLSCGDDAVDLPAVKPLSISDEQLAQLYKVTTGPYDVIRATDVVFNAQPGRVLVLKIFYPDADGKFPLLLFSHGNWSSNNDYDAVINHWVSHGYIVIAPDHLDCCGAFNGVINSLRYGQVGLITERINDVTALLDHLDQLEASMPALRHKMDTTRIAATGHSFGGFTAQQLIGAGTFDPDKERYLFFRDDRIKAVVAISPPGPMFDTITEQSWVDVNKPMLITTGTWDVNASFWPDWRAHKLSFDSARTGQNYALVTQGADHYLGNLICRLERESSPQHDALTMLNAVTTAFLDAYLKDEQQARAFINSDKLAVLTDGFSVLERR